MQAQYTPDSVMEYCYEETFPYRHGVCFQKHIEGVVLKQEVSARVTVYHWQESPVEPPVVRKRNSDRKKLACGVVVQSHEHANLYPLTVAAAEEVLGVPDHTRYRIDVCPAGCIRVWSPLANPRQYFSECKDSNCNVCKCPRCGATRLIKTKKGVREAQQCCGSSSTTLHNMFLDPGLAHAMLMGRKY